MLYDITLTIGHNVYGTRRWTSRDVQDALRHIMPRVTGATLFEVDGMYNGEFERSTRVELFALDSSLTAYVRGRIPALCERLQQECIMCTCTESNTTFIS